MWFVVTVTIFPFSHRSTVFLKMTQKVAFQTCLSNSRAFFVIWCMVIAAAARTSFTFWSCILLCILFLWNDRESISFISLVEPNAWLASCLFIWSICFSTVSKGLAIDLILSKVPSSPRLNIFFLNSEDWHFSVIWSIMFSSSFTNPHFWIWVLSRSKKASNRSPSSCFISLKRWRS